MIEKVSEEEEEDVKAESAQSPAKEDLQGQAPPAGPATGPEVVPRLLPGVRVVRGPDWKWGDQVRHIFE